MLDGCATLWGFTLTHPRLRRISLLGCNGLKEVSAPSAPCLMLSDSGNRAPTTFNSVLLTHTVSEDWFMMVLEQNSLEGLDSDRSDNVQHAHHCIRKP